MELDINHNKNKQLGLQTGFLTFSSNRTLIREDLFPIEPTFNITVINPNDTALNITSKNLSTNITSPFNYLNNSFNINLGHYFDKIEIQGFKAFTGWNNGTFTGDNGTKYLSNTYLNMSDKGMKIR